jgi:mono/diheme cytochrome c family protein
VQECGACHTPYAPGLLPAASWQRLMGGLPRHFGTDASTDAATQHSLSTWLQQNAGTSKRAREEPPEDRITRAAWFSREHHEFNPGTWKRPAIKSPANCSACHAQAAQGRFNEHDVRVPQ